MKTPSMLLGFSFFIGLVGCGGRGGGGGGGDASDTPIDMQPDVLPDVQPDTPGTLQYGDSCTDGAQCVSGFCLANMCSVYCNRDVANDCRAVSAFCVPVSTGGFGCYGSVFTGPDTDDAVIRAGDSITRNVNPLGDADMFQGMLLPGTYTASAGGSGVDVALEIYDEIAQPIGVYDLYGLGGIEVSTVTVSVTSYVFFVVRNQGGTTGPYTFSLL